VSTLVPSWRNRKWLFNAQMDEIASPASVLSEILLSSKGVQKVVSVTVRIYFIEQEEILSFRDEDVRSHESC
jgi:hypothetical protein